MKAFCLMKEQDEVRLRGREQIERGWQEANSAFDLIRDALHGKLGLSPYYLRIFGKPGEAAVFTDPALKSRFDALMQSGSTWENRFTPRFYLAPPRYTEGTAKRISVPLLMCLAEKEVYGNPKFLEWFAQRLPRGEVKYYPVEHFDIYHGETFERVVGDQIAFLKRTLQKYEALSDLQATHMESATGKFDGGCGR